MQKGDEKTIPLLGDRRRTKNRTPVYSSKISLQNIGINAAEAARTYPNTRGPKTGHVDGCADKLMCAKTANFGET